MSTIEQSIDVAVPVRTAYNRWTQFEEFSRFMEGVDRIEQISPTRTLVRCVAGRNRPGSGVLIRPTAWVLRPRNPQRFRGRTLLRDIGAGRERADGPAAGGRRTWWINGWLLERRIWTQGSRSPAAPARALSGDRSRRRP